MKAGFSAPVVARPGSRIDAPHQIFAIVARLIAEMTTSGPSPKSASDLRWRTYIDTPAWTLSGGVETGADGLLGRKIVGKGVAIFCQVDPARFEADRKTYFRYTRWRATRGVAQWLANLGASFPVDRGIFQPRKTVLSPDRMWTSPNGDRSGHDCEPPVPSRLLNLPPTAITDGAELGYYHPDYRTDFPMGDNPYRYYRF